MLHSLARGEMRRQEIRRKLQDTDGELMETLRRFTVSGWNNDEGPLYCKEPLYNEGPMRNLFTMRDL